MVWAAGCAVSSFDNCVFLSDVMKECDQAKKVSASISAADVTLKVPLDPHLLVCEGTDIGRIKRQNLVDSAEDSHRMVEYRLV
jgi:hypothetical protein